MNSVLLGIVLAAAVLMLLGFVPAWCVQPLPATPPREPHKAKSHPTPGTEDAALILELLGACLDAGQPVSGALETVARVADPVKEAAMLQLVAGLRIGASWQHSWAAVARREPLAPIYRALSFGVLTGAPSAPILYAEARQLRAQEQRAAEKRASALGVRLVVPLGLCSLPAFICLGVVPVVLAMIPG